MNFIKEEEEKILDYWKKIDAFKRSLTLSHNKKKFVFYDGPPFATGLPHYGHILAGTIKDIITRYAHQTGHYVPRNFGWDCHGVPIEYEIDKTFQIKSKNDVLTMGIDKYNNECRKIVMKYSNEWKDTILRTGRWIDFDNSYKTMDASYMETVWWVFKQLYDNGQVYRGKKVMPFSTGLRTCISNFEASQNYKDTNVLTLVVSFPLLDDPEVSFLAWTTTVWTLPCNLALCVHPDSMYVKVNDCETNKKFILQEKCLGILYKTKKQYSILDTFKGIILKDTKYVPLFEYEKNQTKEKAFRITVDKYVTNDSGTGIVHQAPGFGEDDYRVCMDAGIFTCSDDLPCPIDDTGCFTDDIPDFARLHIKDANKSIQKALERKGRVILKKQHQHSYPFCWRSDTPLIYKAVGSWFVKVESIIPRLIANVKETRWVPEVVKEKRFVNWLCNARDWNVSRKRYWGTPLPLWVNEDFSEVVCVGSIEELQSLSKVKGINDLHRDKIDHITIPSQKGNGVLRRIEDVFDCWFESGCMPYAQNHYPFENKLNFPADFVAEGLDQTRGWFYTMLVLSTHLFDESPFKNLIVNGLVLAEDGKKMSKRLKNYPDPKDILNKYGADALRLYLINSPVVHGEPMNFKEEKIKEIISSVFIPWKNALIFFMSLSENFIYDRDHISSNFMDIWILSRCESFNAFIKEEMKMYRLHTIVPKLLKIIEEVTNWYIRFNRKRFKDQPDDLQTLYKVLCNLTIVMAPFMPFMTETMYQKLKIFDQKNALDSVHFCDFPDERCHMKLDVEHKMERMQNVVEQGRAIRDKYQLPLKIPLLKCIIINKNPRILEDLHSMESYIKNEINVVSVILSDNEEIYNVSYKCEANMQAIGKKFKKDAPKVKLRIQNMTMSEINHFREKKFVLLDGITLAEEDILCTNHLNTIDDYISKECDNGTLLLLNIKKYPDLEEKGLIREFVSRIQRLRKKKGLHVSDQVDILYTIEKDPNALFERMTQNAEFQNLMESAFANRVEPMTIAGIDFSLLLAKEEQKVNDINFTLFMMKNELSLRKHSFH